MVWYARRMQYQCLPDWRAVSTLSGLADLSNPPKKLFYRGTWNPALFANCVAVIGSRRMTDYGRRAIEKILPELVFAKKTIISGFMYGVDQYAHRVCIENGGKTVAVLGWGINQMLEDSDKKLAESIIDSGGLIVSEWEEQRGTLWTFPVRNRIVAALSTDVIVVEAAEKSGSLITATIAKKLQRTLWAVPGPITSRLSYATNMMIASGKAKMWVGQIEPVARESRDPLIRLLQEEPLRVDDIARKLKTPIDAIGAQLSLLTLTGQLTEEGGKYYVRKN